MGGTNVPSAVAPATNSSSCMRDSCNSRSSEAIIRLKPMSAKGDPGRVPLLVCVHPLWPIDPSPRQNHVCWWISCRRIRSPGGMDVCDLLSAEGIEALNQLWDVELVLVQDGFQDVMQELIGGEKINSRNMWWKAAFKSRKMVALVRCFCWATCAWSLIVCTPVTVCWDGRPPSWPMVLRDFRVGRSLPLVHACITLAKVLDKRIPLYPSAASGSPRPLYRAQSRPPL